MSITNELMAIQAGIAALSPPDKLRLAADLMEQRRGDVAYPIIRVVADELGAAIALAKLEKRPAPEPNPWLADMRRVQAHTRKR